MNKKIFIMLTKTPYDNDENIDRLERCKKDDVVVFAQDSVFTFLNPESEIFKLVNEKISQGVRIFSSEPDCLARGVCPSSNIKLVSYPEQIDLICECELSF
jgi:sulfur relay protein TusB/DsrH